jgi:predicted patatin/cPLA2 family phospholipase
MRIPQLLRKRRDEASKPGQREDGRSISLVIEGGAMRGVVSGGMVAALEYLGFRDCFDAVYGSSAGAISAAYFIARQARYGTTIFYEDINNSSFIDFRRLVRGQPIVSLEFLLDEVCARRKPLAIHNVLNADIPLFVVAASLNERAAVALSGFEEGAQLIQALRASARIPFFAGTPVAFRGDRFLDASIYESIPFRAAMRAMPSDIVVLLTRPAGAQRSPPGWIDRNIVAPYLQRLDTEVARHYLERADEYSRELNALMNQAQSGTEPQICLIQLPSTSRNISPFETNRERLVSGAMDGFHATYAALGFPVPELVELITPVECSPADNPA